MNNLVKKSFVKMMLIGYFMLVSSANQSLYAQKKNHQTPSDEPITSKDISSMVPNAKLPSLSDAQRDSLANIKVGMVIFNTTSRRPEYFDGEAWYKFHNDHYIGERFGGGIVFYVDNTGKHGLIVASADQSSDSKWGFFDEQLGANIKALGGGSTNTEKIYQASKQNQTAGRICSELVLNGFDDWFLPSMDELNLVYANLKMAKIGVLSDALYWSSSETDFNNAWLQDFTTGDQKEQHVNEKAHVRAVRAF